MLTQSVRYYQRMHFIRSFERLLLRLFGEGMLNGTTHTSLGQEHIAVSYFDALDLEKDIIFSNHRCHGHFLSYSDDPYRLLCEIMGKSDGVCGGVGGSQHLHFNNFFSNGVQGGIVPNAVGAALAEKRKESGAVTTVFLGDGTFGEGVIYEAFNLAALWRLPVVFVVENNGIAQSTPTSTVFSGSFTERFQAFGITQYETSERDPVGLHTLFAGVVDRVRREEVPAGLVVHTDRLGPHSKSDDTRTADELAEIWEKDPLAQLAQTLDDEQVAGIELENEERLCRIHEEVLRAPDAGGRG